MTGMQNNNCASTAAAKILGAISKTRRHGFELLLSQFERIEITRICIDVKLDFGWNFKYQAFYEYLCSCPYPPMEFLWKLHVLQLMPLDFYLLSIYSQAEIFKHLENNIFLLCCQENEEDCSFFIQSGILSYLVSKAFPEVSIDEHGERLREISSILLKNIMLGIFTTEEKNIKANRYCSFLALWNCGILDGISLYRFCSYCTLYFLQLHPTTTDLDAYELQENVQNKTSPFHLQFILEKVVKTLDPTEVVHILENAVKQSDTNWKCYMVVVTSFIMAHKDASSLMSKMVSSFQKEAYACSDPNLLCKSLLISRQIALSSGASLHVSYKHWFQATFSDCIRLRNANSFSLLIQALSDFAPLEKNAEFLKVSIECSFSLPQEYQLSYADYIILLKTRVKDLKPEQRPEQTIEKVLLAFEEMGKIPPVILEASLIQKHKFLNEFLPALLVPRMIPQVPDAREKFIAALDQIGKIPSSMLQKYRSACLQEELKLLASIDMIDDNSIEILDEMP